MTEPDLPTIPLDAVDILRSVLGERCRVVVETRRSGERTITITTDEGHICTYRGRMDFSYVLNEGGE